MTRKSLLALVAAASLAVLAWDLAREGGAKPAVDAIAARAPEAQSRVPHAAPAPALAPVASAPAPSVNFLRPAAAKGTATALGREFAAATSYRALYERLKDSPLGRTPEGQYYLYQILKACATVADRRSTFSPQRANSPAILQEQRERVLAQFPEGSAAREQRLAALDQLSVDKCEGLGGIAVSEADLNGLLKSAVLGGDPKARLVQAETDMWAERRAAASGRPGMTRPTLGDTQMDAVRQGFTSRDPEAIALAGQLLSYQFRDVTLRLPGDPDPVDTSVLRNAALLLACEYGYPCGENAQMVLNGCALQGRCGVASLPDFLFYFSASPYEAQAMDRYRAALRQMADSGDATSLGFSRFTTNASMSAISATPMTATTTSSLPARK